jgi:hypothetical protein
MSFGTRTRGCGLCFLLLCEDQGQSESFGIP